MVKERRSGEELRQMMLAAARQHEECGELEDLFIFGPTPRPDANWGFGIAGKENKVSVACYTRLDQIASQLQGNTSCLPSRLTGAISKPGSGPWSMTTLPSRRGSPVGGAYDLATFKKLEGQPNWTMEWNTDDHLAKAAFERIVRSVQTQIELE